MRMHRDASHAIADETCEDSELLGAARRSWDEAVELGERHGYRNAQATVLAPTGTISFLMDCDTTGVEPDFSLVKFKELVGGGQMTIVNRTVPLALANARLLRAAGRADRGIPGRARHDRGSAGSRRGAPRGLRRRRRRAGDLAHGPHQDDGRRAAVHLRSDLEDREPARAGDRRGHRRRLHRGLAARDQGAGDLPRRVEDRAGAAHGRPEAKGRAGRRRRDRRAGGRQGARRGRAAAQADAARAPVDHAQVLDRRPRGLHHGRHVRGRRRSGRSSSPTSARRARRCGG